MNSRLQTETPPLLTEPRARERRPGICTRIYAEPGEPETRPLDALLHIAPTTIGGRLVPHISSLERISNADKLFSQQRDGVLKIAITP